MKELSEREFSENEIKEILEIIEEVGIILEYEHDVLGIRANIRKMEGVLHSLGRVNELHKDIKLYIEKQMTNVSMDLLEYYIGFFSYIRNWRVANGRYPSSKEDAALILDEVLKAQIKISTKEIRKMEGNKARPSKRYVNELVENTGQAREVLAEERFKFREEDNVDSFSRKKILEQFTKADINKMFRECGYTGRMYSKWTNTSKIGAILRSDRCDELIFRYMKERRRQVLDDEDIKEEEWKKYE